MAKSLEELHQDLLKKQGLQNVQPQSVSIDTAPQQQNGPIDYFSRDFGSPMQPQQMQQQPQEDGYLAALGKGFASGNLGVLQGEAGLGQLAFNTDGEWVNKLNALNQQMQRQREWSFDDIKNDFLGYVTNPSGLTYGVANQLGSSAQMMAQGALLASALPASALTGIAGAIGMGAKGLSAVTGGRLGANFAGKTAAEILKDPTGRVLVYDQLGKWIESMSEGGSAGNEKWQESGDIDEGRATAAKNTLINMAILNASGLLETNLLADAIGKLGKKGATADLIGDTILNAIQQAGEEGTQNESSLATQGKTPYSNIVQPWNWQPESIDQAVEAGLLSPLVGGITAGGIKMVGGNKQQQENVQPEQDNSQQQPKYRPTPIAEGIEDEGLANTNPELKNGVDALNKWAYNNFGKDMLISGGARSEQHNREVNGSPTSHHLTGNALDIDLSNFSEAERNAILEQAKAMGFNSDGEDMFHDKGTGLHMHLILPNGGKFNDFTTKAQFANLEDRNSALEAELEQLSKEIEANNAELDNFNKAESHSEEDFVAMDALSSRNNEINNRIEEITGQIEDLNALQDSDNEFDIEKASERELKARHNYSNRQAGKAHTQLESNYKAIRKAQTALAEAQKKNNKKNISKQQGIIENLQTQNSELLAKLRQHSTTRNTISSRLQPQQAEQAQPTVQQQEAPQARTFNADDYQQSRVDQQVANVQNMGDSELIKEAQNATGRYAQAIGQELQKRGIVAGENFTTPKQANIATADGKRPQGNYSEEALRKAKQRITGMSDTELQQQASRFANVSDEDKVKQLFGKELARRGISMGEGFTQEANDSNIATRQETPLGNIGNQGARKKEKAGYPGNVYKGKALPEGPSTAGNKHINELIKLRREQQKSRRLMADKKASKLIGSQKTYSMPHYIKQAIENKRRLAEEKADAISKRAVYADMKAQAEQYIREAYPNEEVQGCKAEKLASEDGLKELLQSTVDKLAPGMGNGVTNEWVEKGTGIVADVSDLKGKEERKENSASYEHRFYSNNDPWYQKWFKENGRKPSNKELYEIAREIYTGEDAHDTDYGPIDDGTKAAADDIRQAKADVEYFENLIQIYDELEDKFKKEEENEKKANDSNSENNEPEEAPKQESEADKGTETTETKIEEKPSVEQIVEPTTSEKPKQEETVAQAETKAENKPQEPSKRFNGERAKATLKSKIGKKKAEESKEFKGVFDESKEDEIIARLKKKMNRLNSMPMFDPEFMTDAFYLGGIYIQKGIRNFAQWSSKMVEGIGENIRPFLPATWDTLQAYNGKEELDNEVMQAVFEFVGDEFDQGKSYDDIVSDFKADYDEAYMPHVEAAYKGLQKYPTDIAEAKENVAEPKAEEAQAESKAEEKQELQAEEKTDVAEKPEEQVNETVEETPKADVPQEHYRIKLNNDQQGVELWFDGRVSEELYKKLLDNGYKLTRRAPKHYYAKQSNAKAMALAKEWGLTDGATEYDSNNKQAPAEPKPQEKTENETETPKNIGKFSYVDGIDGKEILLNGDFATLATPPINEELKEAGFKFLRSTPNGRIYRADASNSKAVDFAEKYGFKRQNMAKSNVEEIERYTLDNPKTKGYVSAEIYPNFVKWYANPMALDNGLKEILTSKGVNMDLGKVDNRGWRVGVSKTNKDIKELLQALDLWKEKGKEESQDATDSERLQDIPDGQTSAGVQENESRGNSGNIREAEDRGNDGEVLRTDGLLQGESTKTDNGRPNGSDKVRERDSVQSEGTGESRTVRAGVEKELAPAQKKNAKPKEVPGHNFTITDEDKIGDGGPKAKFRDNINAIKLLKKLEEENRLATPEEQKVLARYVGWGGLADAFAYSPKPEWKAEAQELKELLSPEDYAKARGTVNDAFYTPTGVIKGIWDILGRMGFKGGKVLEPSMGVGNFYGLMPESMRSKSTLNGVEWDTLTGKIAKQLYQKANINVAGYEEIKYPDNFFDLIISNVPFGSGKPKDGVYDKLGLDIHNYFFMKSIDKVRPGGIVAFITTTGTMQDNADSVRLRKILSSKADLIGAIRLPDTTFAKNAGTSVVSDLIILQKREEGAKPSENSKAWLETVDTEFDKYTGYPEGGKLKINEYFANNPNMVIGTLERGDYRGNLLVNGKGLDVANELQKRLETFPKNIYKPLTGKRNLDSVESAKATFLAPAQTRQGAFLMKDGKVYSNDQGNMVEIDSKNQAKAEAYIKVRDAVKQILADQLKNDVSEEMLQKERDELNKAYDAFIAKHGYLHQSKNKALAADPDFGIILSVEQYDVNKETKKVTAGKKDIFFKRTVNAIKETTSADNASDALALALNNLGTVDLEYMSKLTGKTQKQLLKDLDGYIFQNPESNIYETAEEYLSGNVREKLEYAQEAAKNDPAYEKNVEALKKVQPKDLVAEEISVGLGTPWVPSADIEAFATHILDRWNALEIKFNSALGSWTVTYGKYSKNFVQTSTANTSKWGTTRKTFVDLLDDVLNQRTIQVYDKTEDNKRILNQKETNIAQQKAKEIQAEFKKWIFSDDERRERLVNYYNRNFNNWKLREYDGSHLQLPGYSSIASSLREHQKDAVWRIMQGNTLLAHCVGAGKTWTMQTAAMEMKRLGIAHKSMFVIPNHMLGQFEEEFRIIYPNAKLLVISKESLPDVTVPGGEKMKPADLAKKKAEKNAKRQEVLGKIATEDWDGIIISHKIFKRIPMSPTAYQNYYAQQKEELEQALIESAADQGASGKRVVKDIQKKLDKLEEKLKENVKEQEKDIVIPFEQLGIDQIFVDEADMFKNLSFATKMSRVSGLSTAASQRSEDMFIKTQYLADTHNGRGVCFATGTPISNTMAEMFTMMRYMDTQNLKEHNMNFFDNWAANFAVKETAVERKPDGNGYRTVEKFTKFTNMPELIKMFRKFTDVKTQEELNLDVPKLVNGKPTVIEIEPNEALTDFIKNDIKERSQAIKNGMVDPSVDNMLKLTSDLRKASLDMRLVNPSIPAAGANAKLVAVVDNAYKKYVEFNDTKGAQLIFCDLSAPKGTSDKVNESDNETEETSEETENITVYEEIAKMLQKKGVPKSEIAFIHDAKNDAQKEALFARVRNGQVRFLLGSTEKMGAGTNVQKNLVALHDVDAPWRPRDIEQRHGRIIRQGNQNKVVEIFNYVTKGSFDANMWEKLKNKATMIGQAMSNNLSGRTIEDADANVLSFGEIEALASDNPLMAERVMVNAELNKYEALRDNYIRNKEYARRELQRKPAQINAFEARLGKIKADLKQRKDISGDNFSMQVSGKTFTQRKDAQAALDSAIKNVEKKQLPSTIVGKIGGFDIEAKFVKAGQDYRTEGSLFALRAAEDTVLLTLKGNNEYELKPSLQSIEHTVMHEPDKLADGLKAQIANAKKEQKSLQEEAEKPFEYEKKYQEVKARAEEIDKLLEIGKEEQENSSTQENNSVTEYFVDDETLNNDSPIENNIAHGKQALMDVINNHVDIENAMYRSDVGNIDFKWGKPGDRNNYYNGGYGLSHILARRLVTKQNVKDVLDNIVEGIAKGNAVIKNNIAIIQHNGYVIILSNNYNGQKTNNWLFTGYKIDADYAQKEKENPAGASGEGFDSTVASAIKPIRSRLDRAAGFSVMNSLTEKEHKVNSKENKSALRVAWGMLRKSGLTIVTDKAEYLKELNAGKSAESLKTSNGQVYGFVKNNIIYLDAENMRADIPIHEYTHIWDRVVRATNRELWEHGKSLLKELPLWNEIKNNPAYKQIADNEDLLASEVHARLAGNYGYNIFKKTAQGTKGSLKARLTEWFKSFWNYLKNSFARWGAEDVEQVSLQDFIRMPISDLVKGVNIGNVIKSQNIKSEDVVEQFADSTSRKNTAIVDLKDAASKILPIKASKVQRHTEDMYDPHAKVGLISNNGDVTALAGIIGMYIDREKSITKANKGAREEMLRMAIENAKNVDDERPGTLNHVIGLSDAQKIRRATAAYMRERALNPERAEQKYPLYHQAFETMINQPRNMKLKEKLDNFVDVVQKYESMSDIGKAQASMSAERIKEPQTFTEKAKEYWHKVVYPNMFDDKDVLQRVELKIQEITGEVIKTSDSAYAQARLAGSSAANRITMLIQGPSKPSARKAVFKAINDQYDGVMEHEVFFKDIVDKTAELDKKSKTDAKLAQYLKDNNMDNWEHALRNYLLANRFREIWKTRPNYKAPMTQQQAEAVVNSVPAELKEAAELYYKFNENILNIMKHDGLVSEESYNALRKYEAYCPLFRDFADEAAHDKFISRLGNAGTFANINNGLKYLTETGSDRTVMDDPVMSMMRMSAAIITKCEHNKVAQKLVALSKNSGIGAFVMPEYDAEGKQKHSANAQESVFTVYEKGVQNAYRTTPELYEVLSGDGETAGELFKLMDCIAGKAARALRTGATISPGFYARNFIRDNASLAINSRNNFIPIYHSIKYGYKLATDDEFRARFEASGASMASYFKQDKDSSYKTLEEMAGRDKHWYDKTYFTSKLAKMIAYAWNKYMDVGELIENSNRAAEFALALEKGKSDIEAAMDAKEGTLDFSRGGKTGRKLNRIIPFFNAVLQGGDKTVRTFKEQPVKSLIGMASMALVGAMMWSLYHDDDWWKELSDEEKFSAWHIPFIDDDGKQKHFTIPLPQEYGMLTSGSVIAALEQMNGQNPNAAKNFVKQFLWENSPSILPTIFRVPLEVVTNYDIYFRSPIEGKKYENLASEARYNNNTSEVSKALGNTAPAKAMELSPLKIEHIIRGYFGTAGVFMARVPNQLIENGKTPKKYWNEMPFINDFIKSDFEHSKSMDDWYKLKKNLDEYHNTYERGTTPAYMTGANKISSQLSKIRKQINMVRNSGLPNARDIEYNLNQRAIQIARIGLQNFSKYQH